MKKKLLAAAVAGVLAAPVAAFAQSSVTISGFFKGGFESLSYGNTTKNHSSQTGVVDDSSRVIFNVREDLGGGLAAIGQIDMRFGLDSGALSAAGNNHVGLVSKNWGRLFIGRQDLHYFGRESELTVRGSLRADSISILAFAGAGTTGIAGATRTPNVVHYTTPNWNGLSAILAYSSTGATAVEGDIGNGGARKGKAWNFAPVYAAKNWTIGYSYWSSKPDRSDAQLAAAGAAFIAGPTPANAATLGGLADQRGDRLFGSFRWGGFKVGLAWDKSRLEGMGTEVSDRTAWSLPASYSWGRHSIHGHYSVARDDKRLDDIFGGDTDTKARMFALSYAYDLSKRTSIAVTYARINNGDDAAYNLFTSAALGLGAGTGAIAFGEDPRMWGITMRHAF